jgi:glycosyltransferase involved in cell wall biosynthesis
MRGTDMRIAVIGPLGLPARIGGMTRHGEELSVRLAAAGHDVTVFGRSTHVRRTGTYRGVRVRRVPVAGGGSLQTLLHGFLASVLAAAGRFDVVHYHGLVSSVFCALPWLAGAKLAVTIHSLDYRHAKWGPGARAVLRWSEWCAIRLSRVVIAVSEDLAADLRRRYPSAHIVHIPNGLTPPAAGDPAALERLGLQPDGYTLFVGRLVPEKGIQTLVAAAGPDRVVAVVGSGDAYERTLRAQAGPNVRFCGAQPPEVLTTLYRNARCVVTPSEHEGFNLTLLEAMGHGCCIVASDIPAHRELADGAAIFFTPRDAACLAEALDRVNADPRAAAALGEAARERAHRPTYDWDAVAAQTGVLLASIR